MRGFAAVGPVHNAEEVLQIGKWPGGLFVLASKHIHRLGRFHLDCLTPVSSGPRCAEIPLKVCEGRFHPQSDCLTDWGCQAAEGRYPEPPLSLKSEHQ
jgi:hypothetical protein